jgi:hypothetical protein
VASTAGCLFLWPAVLLRQVQHSVSACIHAASQSKEYVRHAAATCCQVTDQPYFTIRRHQLCSVHTIPSVV